ncbi:blood vessel epicardial substance [Nilaparvata lugens]|uniref:blood vessel epicardial substance n=1 Tax=Nilaparvata lugens TaxID=108931 RepID=UPI000B99A779|nr:blood vessel epicardial substance [Nilaparvata lugens]
MVMESSSCTSNQDKKHCCCSSTRLYVIACVEMDNQTALLYLNSSLGEIYLFIGDNDTILADNATSNYTTDGEDDVNVINGEGSSCGEWEPAQHNLYQLSNICFAAAFILPRSFKPSVLLVRALLSVGFLVSAMWAGVHICSPDMFAWNVLLSVANLVHLVILTCRFLPPALSVELTELYIRLFKPLKVTKKHFKELTREASLCHLAKGESYAVEDATPADERLSILLRGKLRVTCDNMHLHYINCHQFIDSPEWEASHETSDELFQVTITAEEDCMYLCWPKLRLDRVLRHRPMLQTVLSNLIGKDITQKLYSLNEQLGTSFFTSDLNKAASSDHWRHVMERSLSVDAVDTGTRGHVRSVSWKNADKDRRNSLGFSENESPVHGGQQCWIPVVANHFPATSPFAAAQPPHHTIHAPPPPPCLPGPATSAAQMATAQQPPVALIPVIVPVIAPSSSNPISPSYHRSTAINPITPSYQSPAINPISPSYRAPAINPISPSFRQPARVRTREVKFDESRV